MKGVRNMKNIGKELPKESWESAAEHLEIAAPLLANVLRKINHDGKGEQDKEEFLAEMQLAVTAMRYVASFATDKCRFITY